MRECSVSEKMPHMINSAALQEIIKRGARNESICNTDLHERTLYSAQDNIQYRSNKSIYSATQYKRIFSNALNKII